MMRLWKLSALLLIGVVPMLFTACTNEAYDSGDGSLSYLCVEFAEVHTSHDTIIRKATTDGGEELTFSKAIRTAWTAVPDSSYRALLYYDKATNPVGVFSLQRVLVLSPKTTPVSEGAYPTDPLSVESIWTSESGKYVNLSLILKTGNADGIDAQQWLSLVVDPHGTDAADLLLLHKQNGVPEYYSARVYISIPVSALPSGKPINLRIVTYDGEKTYRLR